MKLALSRARKFVRRGCGSYFPRSAHVRRGGGGRTCWTDEGVRGAEAFLLEDGLRHNIFQPCRNRSSQVPRRAAGKTLTPFRSCLPPRTCPTIRVSRSLPPAPIAAGPLPLPNSPLRAAYSMDRSPGRSPWTADAGWKIRNSRNYRIACGLFGIEFCGLHWSLICDWAISSDGRCLHVPRQLHDFPSSYRATADGSRRATAFSRHHGQARI